MLLCNCPKTPLSFCSSLSIAFFSFNSLVRNVYLDHLLAQMEILGREEKTNKNTCLLKKICISENLKSKREKYQDL